MSGSLLPYVEAFRKDFEEGKVVLEDPEKDKKDARKKKWFWMDLFDEIPLDDSMVHN